MDNEGKYIAVFDAWIEYDDETIKDPFCYSFDHESQEISAVNAERIACAKKLYILLNTPGGYQDEMNEILSIISSVRSGGGKSYGFGTRTVSSAGAYIWSACDERYVIDRSEFMWHTGGLSDEKQKGADKAYMREFFSKTISPYRERVFAIFDENIDERSQVNLTGSELFESGLAHRMFSSSIEMRDYFMEISGWESQIVNSTRSSVLERFWDIAGRRNRQLFSGAWGQTLWKNSDSI